MSVETQKTIKNSSVLLIEDNSTNAQIFKEMLTPIVENITHFEKGTEGLGYFLKERPDLLLLDLQMPDMNGLEIIHKIRDEERDLNTPIIVVTSSAIESLRERVFEAGANEFLTKPVRLQNFLETIVKYLPRPPQ